MFKIARQAIDTPSIQRRNVRWIAAICGAGLCGASLSTPAAIGQTSGQTGVKPTRLPLVMSAAVQTHSPAAIPVSAPIAATISGSQPSASGAIVRHQTNEYLRSSTSRATTEISRRLISEATIEYNSNAWLSAETTAWEAMKQAAIGIDLADRERTGTVTSESDSCETMLQRAHVAMAEARDFGGIYGPADDDAIRRIARSHRTAAIAWDRGSSLGPNEASDRYLDYARTQLAVVAGRSVEAAEAMDLLAAIHLGRADERLLPSAMAICLRRAAIQGQPANASLAARLGMHLADVGLLDESRWALEHSLSIQFDPVAAQHLVAVLQRTGDQPAANRLIATIASQTPESATRIARPTIVELSPDEFASVSKSVLPPSSAAPVQRLVTGQAATDRVTSSEPEIVTAPSAFNPTSMMGRLAGARLNSKSSPSQAKIAGSYVVDPTASESTPTAANDVAEQEKPPGRFSRMIDAIRRPW